MSRLLDADITDWMRWNWGKTEKVEVCEIDGPDCG